MCIIYRAVCIIVLCFQQNKIEEIRIQSTAKEK